MGLVGAVLPGVASGFCGVATRGSAVGIGGKSFKRFTLLDGELVAGPAAAGGVVPGPATGGADVMDDWDGSRCCRFEGNGVEGDKWNVSAGRLSVVIDGGAISVVAGVANAAGCRFAAVGAGGAMVGSTIRGSFGLAGEMLTGVCGLRSAKLGVGVY
jgi:hypothetical protein